MVSSESATSAYCLEEVQFAYDLKLRIFPVIVEGGFQESMNSGLESKCWLLRAFVYTAIFYFSILVVVLMRRYQWTYFDKGDFDASFTQLMEGVRGTLQRIDVDGVRKTKKE